MLTQCPECQTTFRLHVKQLKAAGGKVRCSRCHTTFDALDNLFDTPPVTVQEPPAAPEPQASPPFVTKTAPLEVDVPTPSGVEPEELPAAPPATPEQHPIAEEVAEEDKERVISIFDKPVPETPEEALDALISELKSSAKPRVHSVEEPELPSQAIEEPTFSDNDELFSTALEFIDEMATGTPIDAPPLEDRPAGELLPLVESEEEPEELNIEPVEEELTIEPVAEEPLPLFEPEEEPEELNIEPVEEELTIEPVAEEPLPLFELAEEPGELSIEPVEEELTIEPLVEPLAVEEPVDTSSETELDPLFGEATAEPPGPAEPADAFDLYEDPRNDPSNISNFFDEEPDGIAEQLLAESGIEVAVEPLFESASSEPELEEPSPIELDSVAEPGSSEDEFAAFFEATEPQVTEEPLPDDSIELAASEPEVEELLTDQDDMFDLFDEETTTLPSVEPIEIADEAALDELQPPHQIEEQAAELPPTRSVAKPSGDEMYLDTGSSEPPPPPEPAIAQPAASYTIPAELVQEKRASSSSTILWGLGIVLMCGALVLQYLYYFRLQLVDNPQLRPVLSAMCSVTGCELPPRRDLGHIELVEHLMQFHPTYEESLLITATLTNSADFDQPYPLLEVIMTDIEQQVVARRHFPPELYLNNFSSGDTFAAHSEVPLMLEVLDPGNRAVGFEFRFY